MHMYVTYVTLRRNVCEHRYTYLVDSFRDLVHMRCEQESIKCLSISTRSKYFACFTCLAIQYLGDICNWGLCRLMHHLFKIMYNILGLNIVFLSRLTTINLIDLIILMKQQ